MNEIPTRNDLHDDIAMAHALSTVDSTLTAVKTLGTNDFVLILSRATLADAWRNRRKNRGWDLGEAVTDARGFLAAHIEEYALWEAELEARLGIPE